jgi:hypothetical protein
LAEDARRWLGEGAGDGLPALIVALELAGGAKGADRLRQFLTDPAGGDERGGTEAAG